MKAFEFFLPEEMPLRFAFICQDSHGGVQPYAALAVGLRRVGHEVCLVAPENYARFVRSHNLPFSQLTGDVQAFLKSAEFAAVAAKGFLAVQRLAVRKASELVTQWMTEALEACRDCDTIVAGIGGHGIAEAVAEKLGCRYIQAHLQPLTPTGAFPGPLGPSWLSRLGQSGNRLGHQITRQMMWQMSRPATNKARRTVLGIPSAPFWGRLGKPDGSRSPVLYGYSRYVLPHPREWGNSIHVTGYWFLDGAGTWSPPTELQNFLDAGSPPIVVGFGSMSDRDADATAKLVTTAVQKAGVRAVLLSGWGGVRSTDLGPSVYPIESVPHDWLYPKCSLVVHHGGAGTTGAVFRAGLPSVVVPFTAEQPFWGRRVATLGCGPNPIPRKRLTSDNLAKAIQEGLQESIRKRAAEMGELVRTEDGVRDAIGYLLG